MKKAEEIAVEVGLFKSIEAVKENFGLQITRDCYIGTSDRIIRAIKQAQIDAIETTVKRCAEEAKMSHKYYPKEGKGNYKKYCEFKGSYPERYDFYGESIGVDVFQVNQTSILQVAKKLKKELE